MNKLLIALAFILSLGAGAWAMTETKTECVEFEGVEFCETTTVIHVGDKEVPIDDPWSLFDSIGNSKAEKISLWDIYKMPPFITELANQLKITEDELIEVLGHSGDPAWAALYELTRIYEGTKKELVSQGVSNQDLDRLFQKIIKEITDDIREQLKDFEGTRI